ncbi:hypothetical protein SAMN05660874_03797 [Saccharopolyspora flava]|uniref:Uncharacterized protein n=1 Tax=Saccharopolyspora flava TaxID=95161 RepID=A0A1I6T9R9_9PSEU|nr:hypothetical protein SAMN05660874_03797 [Saccharopolyspora flava]
MAGLALLVLSLVAAAAVFIDQKSTPTNHDEHRDPADLPR